MITFLNELEWDPSSLCNTRLLSCRLPVPGRDGITEELGMNHSECVQHVELFHLLCHKGNVLGPGERLMECKQEGVMLSVAI